MSGMTRYECGLICYCPKCNWKGDANHTCGYHTIGLHESESGRCFYCEAEVLMQATRLFKDGRSEQVWTKMGSCIDPLFHYPLHDQSEECRLVSGWGQPIQYYY